MKQEIKNLKKIKDKIIAGTLTAATLLSVTGCGDDNSKTPDSSTTIESTIDTTIDDTVITTSPKETTVVVTTPVINETEASTTTSTTTEQVTTIEQTTTTEQTQAPVTTSETSKTTESTTTPIETTEVSTAKKEEKKYDKLTKENINDLDYFDHYAEEFHKSYFPEGVFCSYGILGECREVYDLKEEFKMYFMMINYEYLNKDTIKHALKNLDDWNMNMCLCYSFNILIYRAAQIVPDYDTFCVDEEMKSILLNLAKKTKKITNKTIEDYDKEVIIPFFDGTGEINMNNVNPYVYCLYVMATEKACQISGKNYYPHEPLKDLYRYIIDNVTKDDIINGKGKTIGQYIND